MIGFWKMKNGKGWTSHANGLNEEQVQYFHNLVVGDRLVIFSRDTREGETGADLSLKRSSLSANQESQNTNSPKATVVK